MGCVTAECYGADVATPRDGASREALMLLHGSAGSSAMWRPIAATLNLLYRVISPDLIGYGASVAWPRRVPFDLQAECLALEPLLSCCADDLHVIGYSYGGVVALAVALAYRQRLRTLTLIEPVFFNALRYAGEERALLDLMRVRGSFERALEREGAAAALPPFIDFWTGAGAWDRLPHGVRDEMLRCAGKIALDWRAAFVYSPDRQQLAALGPRTLLIRGDQSPVAMLRLVDALHDLMPESTLEVIAGANHLLPLTRAQDVTKAVVSHLHADAERHLR